MDESDKVLSNAGGGLLRVDPNALIGTKRMMWPYKAMFMSSTSCRSIEIYPHSVPSMFKIALIVGISLFMMGCTGLHNLLHTIGTVESTAHLPEESETIVVIGVSDSVHIAAFQGDVIDGKFKNGMGAVLAAMPKNGYVVGKVASGKQYAILGVRMMGDMPGPSFSACGVAKVAVFDAPKGKVVYIGTVEIGAVVDSRIRVIYSDNLDAARKFIDGSFPALAGKVEATSRMQMATARACG
jgi:hypothetical protein